MSSSLDTLLIRYAFNGRVRQKLWKKLAANAKYNIPPYTVIDSLLRRVQSKRKPLAVMYARLARNRGVGIKFGSALTGYASPEEIQLILAGESSGDIGSGFELAADLLKSKSAIRKAIIGACAYPLFLGILSIAMLLMISTRVIPQFAEMFPPERWTGAAATLYSITSFVNSTGGIIAAIAILALCMGIFISFPRWTGPWRKKVDGFGPWGIYRLAVGSSWLFSFATLMRAGIHIRHILSDMMAAADCTPYLKERLAAILHQFNSGKGFGESLTDCGMNFPGEETVDDIRAFSYLPDFEFRLFEIMRDKMEEDIEQIQSKMKKINTTLLFLVFFEICGLLAAISGLQAQLSV